jgi:chromosome partitioning protein
MYYVYKTYNGGINVKEIIAIINQKGGVGKTTTTLAIGAGFIIKGFKLLYIDLDAQGNLSHTLKVKNDSISSIELLEGKAKIVDIIQQTSQGNIIPASPALAGADALITAVGKEYRLKEALNPIKENYDYILIDTPPALGVLTINALTACTGVIIPAQADTYSLQGINQLYATIDAVRQYCNNSLEVKGILLTRYNSRAILSKDIAEIIEQTANQLNTKLFKTTIREAIAIKEAQANQQDIFSYAPKNNAAVDYAEFIDELLETGGNKNG